MRVVVRVGLLSGSCEYITLYSIITGKKNNLGT